MGENDEAITLETERGTISCRYYRVPNARRAALWVGGAGGGWDSPADGLYPDLCEELLGGGIASLRVRYRHPANLEESVWDVLAGLVFLEQEGVEEASLAGHSFGGAVVIQAAAVHPIARTVITLATQSYGAHPVADLPPECSILLIHGTHDETLSQRNSEYVYSLAHEPKRLLILPGVRHGLGEAADELRQVVREWVITELRAGDADAATRQYGSGR